jgi:hypothetical protein
VPASAGEFPVEAARFTSLDLRGYQQMRLALNVGGQAGLTGTILYYRYSLDGGATWYDTDAAIQLDGSTNQAFWGNWQPIPPMLRQSIDTTVALFGRDGDGSTVVELVDWFSVGEHATAAAITVTVPDRGRGLQNGYRRSGGPELFRNRQLERRLNAFNGKAERLGAGRSHLNPAFMETAVKPCRSSHSRTCGSAPEGVHFSSTYPKASTSAALHRSRPARFGLRPPVSATPPARYFLYPRRCWVRKLKGLHASRGHRKRPCRGRSGIRP